VSDPTLDSASPAKQTHFYFLDALRGLAAVWVIFYHASDSGKRLTSLAAVLPDWFETVLLKWGSLGVSIFFVLSGFVIAHSLRKAIVDAEYFKQFSLRRFVRLTPPYYLSIVLALAYGIFAAKSKGVPFESPSPAKALTHLAYVQDLFGLGHINEVYWTLCLEVQFYLSLCGLLWIAQMLAKRIGDEAARAWVFGSSAIVAAIFPLFIEQTSRPTYFLPLWYGFLLGVFAYWSWQKRIPAAAFYAYSALFIVSSIVHQDPFSAACGLSALLLHEAGRFNQLGVWLKAAPFQFLGKISYSLYLNHVMVVGALFKVGYGKLGMTLTSDLLLLGASIVGSIGLAWVTWWIAERPSIQWSQRLKAS
jgi:peptidoglycan/LPS O-acetylase OafA/YrhL